jgi:hypothetical protein
MIARETRTTSCQIAARGECRQHIGADDRFKPVLQIAHPLRRSQQLGTPAVHRPAVTTVDFEQQAVLGLEMIGHAAGIGAGGAGDVTDRNGVEAIGRE